MATLTRLHRALWILALLATQIGCDQATKELAERELKGSSSHSFLGGSVRLIFAENEGAFLGLGNTLSADARLWIFVIIVGAGLLGGLAYLLLKKKLPLDITLAGAVLVSGGLGNLIDRAFNDGRVIDFMQVGLGPLKTGIFNVADVQIMAAAFAMVWLSFRHKDELDQAPDPAGPGTSPPAAA
jgi:signal peptidase II